MVHGLPYQINKKKKPSRLRHEALRETKYKIWYHFFFLSRMEVGGGGLNKYKIWAFYEHLGDSNRFFWSRRDPFWINTKFSTAFFEFGGAVWINTKAGHFFGSFLVVTPFSV